MQIELRRLKANHLYTEGQVIINGHLYIPYTVEHTFTMLPAGEYQLRLTKDKKRRRVIGIYPESLNPQPSSLNLKGYFESGHSFLSAQNPGTVIIGVQLIPGAVKKGREHYDRLFDRIEKCEQRQETISLFITDGCCEESQPIAHWLK